MPEDDFRPYVIERPGKRGRIRLNADARWWAKQHGMTDREMASYLLGMDEGVEPSGEREGVATEDFLPDVTLSENVEDRRQEPIYGAGAMQQVWGAMPH